MAKGAPDYYSTVNIRLQELARLMVRPAYGGCLCERKDGWILAHGTHDLFEIEGQGQIYGISLGFSGLGGNLANYNLDFYVDDVRQIYEGLEYFGEFPSRAERGLYPVVEVWNDVDYRYVLVIPGDITFETSFKLQLYRDGGVNIYLYCHCSYAKVL